MLRLRKSKAERTTKALEELIASANELLRDERLRGHLQSAFDHGARATRRARKDDGLAGMGERLATDKKLRKNVRAMLDDLDRAGGRVRRRRGHRVRNVLLLIGGGGVAVAAVPSTRRWIVERLRPSENGRMTSAYETPEPDPLAVT